MMGTIEERYKNYKHRKQQLKESSRLKSFNEKPVIHLPQDEVVSKPEPLQVPRTEIKVPTRRFNWAGLAAVMTVVCGVGYTAAHFSVTVNPPVALSCDTVVPGGIIAEGVRVGPSPALEIARSEPFGNQFVSQGHFYKVEGTRKHN